MVRTNTCADGITGTSIPALGWGLHIAVASKSGESDPTTEGHIVGVEHFNRYAKWPLGSVGSNNKLLMGGDLEFENPTTDEIWHRWEPKLQ